MMLSEPREFGVGELFGFTKEFPPDHPIVQGVYRSLSYRTDIGSSVEGHFAGKFLRPKDLHGISLIAN